MTHAFKCWFPDDGDTDGDAHVVEAFDAEDAAEEATKTFRSGPDYLDHINGDPIRVAVRRADDGIPNVLMFDVSAHAEVRYSAEEVEDEQSDAPHVVLTSMPFGFRCNRCGATKGMVLPVSVDDLSAANEVFTAQHRECAAVSS